MLKMNRIMRIMALLLVLCLAATVVVGCKPAAEPKAKVKIAFLYAIPNPSKAGGWDRADWPGILYLRDELGWDVAIAENLPYSDTANTAISYAENGYDIVVLPSSAYVDVFLEVAPKYPNTWFILTSVTTSLPNSPHAAAWVPDMYTYGVVVGMIAAKASKTGTIGVSGGVPIPVLSLMYSGIIEGAKYVNPDSKVLVYWVGDWVDIPKHREITGLQIQRGADVIFTVSGPGTTGVLEAAEAGGAKVIGYAMDWYDDAPAATLTSLIVDKKRMYVDMANQFLGGTLEKKMVMCGPEYFTIADFRGTLEQGIIDEITVLFNKLKSGEIVIPEVLHPEITP